MAAKAVAEAVSALFDLRRSGSVTVVSASGLVGGGGPAAVRLEPRDASPPPRTSSKENWAVVAGGRRAAGGESGAETETERKRDGTVG